MSVDLPSFFQLQGKSISDGLLEFELGGCEDDELEIEVNEECPDEIDNDEAFANIDVGASELPDFFKSQAWSLGDSNNIIAPNGYIYYG